MHSTRWALILGASVCCIAATAHAQGVGINGTGAAADTSALLDLNSTSKGFLPPRMTAIQRAGIALPATGLVVYQSDGAAGLYYNVGTSLAPSWIRIADAVSQASGPWVSSGPNLYYSAGKVAVGTSSFEARFTVADSLNGLRVVTNTAGGTLASFGGVGTFKVDAPYNAGGRLSLLENGYLGLGRPAPTSRLDVLGGNWDVFAGEGDLRVGDDQYRLKIGVATSGGGAGSVNIMQQGVPGGYNVLALGAQGNNVLYLNGGTQRAGIGTNSPNAPLGFPPTLGKKITLYPGGTGDVGIGVTNNRLQIYADNPNADVAFGYDQAGVFNERFAVKPTGALAVSGNEGSAGQVLQSNGSGAAATWVSPSGAAYNNVYQALSGSSVTLTSASPVTTVPGLSQAFSVAGNARVLVSTAVPIHVTSCFACGGAGLYFDIVTDGNRANRYALDVGNGQYGTFSTTLMVNVGPGAHTIRIDVLPPIGNDTIFGGGGTLLGVLTLQVIPQ